MEAVSLARLVRFLGSLILFCCACQQPPVPVEKIDTEVLFSPGTRDTLAVRQFCEGKEHGRWVKYYATHQLMEERYFENGVKVDTLRIWWDNGVLQAQYPFNNGEYEGECAEWNREGKMIRRMHYKQGHEVGLQQQWYDDGSLRSNYIMQDGRRFGLLGTKNCINVSMRLAF